MDDDKRGMLEKRLAQAEIHVSAGERLLRQQRAAIEERRRDGHDVALAEELLAEMEESLSLQIADRNRLRQELGGSCSP